MRAFLDYVIYGNPIQDWLIALVIFALSPVVARGVYWLFANVIKKLTEKTETILDDIIVEALEAPLLKLLLVLGIWAGLVFLELPSRVDAITRDIVDFLFTMLIAWFLVRLLDGLIDGYIKPIVEASDNDLDDQLLPILQKISKVLIWTLAILMSLKQQFNAIQEVLCALVKCLVFLIVSKKAAELRPRRIVLP